MVRAVGGGSRFTRALAAIAAVGFVGRVVFLYLSRGWELLGDGYAYRIEADRLLDGHIPGALHPPGWAFVLAVPGGIGLDAARYQRIWTALIGTALVVVVGYAGRAIAGSRVGLVAAGLAAVYPNLWLYERELLSEPLAMLTVAVCILLVYRFRDAPSTAGAIGLGAALGVMALSRSELIAASVLVVVPVILGRTQVALAKRLAWLAGAAAVCVLMILPWFLFNLTRYDEPVPLSVGMGPAMRVGNCGPAYEGELLGYYAFGCILWIPDLSTDHSISDRQLRERAISYMEDRPGRAVVVSMARVGRAFNVYRPLQQAELETERGSALWLTRSAMVAYWVLIPLAIGGAVLARRRSIALYPLLAFPLIVVVAVLPTIGAVRYRAVAEVPLVLLAAIAIEHLIRRWGAANRASAAGGHEPVDDESPTDDLVSVAGAGPTAAADPHTEIGAGHPHLGST